MRRNSVLLKKVQVWNRLYNKNCLIQTETLLVSFLCVIFILLLDCCFRWSEFNNTRTSTSPSYFIRHSSPPFCKNHKKTWEHCIFLVKMFKTVSILFRTLNGSEQFFQWGFFQISSVNYNTSSLLYTCEVINLINKVVISPYVQE